MYERPMMIRQPAVVSADLPDTALAKTAKRFGQTVADRVHMGWFAEGRYAQLMHHGPYSHEGSMVSSPARTSAGQICLPMAP